MTSTTFIRHTITLTLVPAMLCWLWFTQIELFPLSEIRDWMSWKISLSQSLEIVEEMFARSTRFSRNYPMLLARLIGEACGSSIACSNSLTYFPFALGAILLWWILSLFLRSAFIASFAVLIWLLSAPTVHILSWQATLLDRTALAMMFACVLFVYWYLSIASQKELRVLMLGAAWLGTLSTFVLTLNSKESAWPVLALVILLPVLKRVMQADEVADERLSLKKYLLRFMWLAVPIASYALWFFVRYAMAGNDEFARDWKVHTITGDPLFNATNYAQFVFGERGLLMLALLALNSVVLLLALCRLRRWERALQAVWWWIGFAAGMVMCLFTRMGSGYYLFIPLAFFVGFCVTLLVAIVEMYRVKSGVEKVRLFAMPRSFKWMLFSYSVIIVCLVSSLIKADGRSAFVAERVVLSRNFIQSIKAAHLQYGPILCFNIPAEQWQGYLFIDSPEPTDVTRWALNYPYRDAKLMGPCKMISLDSKLRLKP
jgi:hypothetical protein